MVPSDVETDSKVPTLRKLYYSIGEVSRITGIPTHVLRYWENEFPQLHPKKSRAGNRTYQERDLALVQRIRTLLYEQKFTIAGAKTQLDETEPKGNGQQELVEEVRQELREILNILDTNSGRGAAR
ncbi:MerR family transcriptional regulator [candidate division KSB1 bacterium]|nr:MAG: MerR family transcriptional regulator [candidate division KSB1 bacterium]